MGPKKAGSKGSKVSSSAAVPVVDSKSLLVAQNRYRTATSKGSKVANWISSDLKSDTQFINKLVRARLMLDKEKEIRDELKDRVAFVQLVQAVYSSLPRAVECGPSTDGSGRLSLSMVLARIRLLDLLLKEKATVTDELLFGETQRICRLLEKGFSRDSWQKHWYDPKSEELVEKRKDEKEQSSAATAAQLYEQLANHYGRLYISVKLRGEAAEEVLTNLRPADFTKAYEPELTAAKQAAPVKAAEPPKQQQQQQQQLQKGDMKTQKEKVQHIMQADYSRDQQRNVKGARDAERSRDAKRGKQLPEDNKLHLDFEQARREEDEIAKEATKVFEFLEGKVLGEGISAEEHLQKLQSLTTVGVDDLKQVAKELAASKDKEPTPLQHCKQQLGTADPSADALAAQLKALANDQVWQLFLDEAAALQGKAGKQLTWSSCSEFESHVVSKYLENEAKELPLAFDGAPDMAATYWSRGHLTRQLADDAADSVRQGHADETNPWIEAFSEECPLSRYLRTQGALRNEEYFMPPAASVRSTDDEDETVKAHRLQTAMGFALLQVQRKQVVVDRVQLSHKPDWVVLMYHTLNIFPALQMSFAADPDTLNIYNYWRSKHACQAEFTRVLRPHLLQDHTAVNGSSSSEPQPSFTDGLAADNATMLQMLYADKMLAGPLLLAVQLYLLKATGQGLNVSSAEGQPLNTEDIEAVLGQLQEQQQLELRQFLLEVLCNLSSELTAYKQFYHAQQQERVLPECVPVVVVNHDKESPKLALSREYYEQACLAAAVPVAPHSGCCEKHHREQLQAEAAGRRWSKHDPTVSYEDYVCVSDPVPMDDHAVQLYLLQPTRMVQAQKEKQLKVGTKQGLQALVDKLFAVDKHHPTAKVGCCEEAETVDKRTTWEKVRMELTLAAQLAMHRAELASLIEKNAADLETKQLTRKQLQDRMRALVCQRSAGSIYQLRVWMWFFDKQIELFRKEESSIQEQLRQLSDVGEKDKMAKAPGGLNKTDAKEKEGKLMQRQNLVSNLISSCDSALAAAKNLHSKALTEAQGYPDLIHMYYSAETGQSNPLVSMISVLANELLAPATPGADAARAQLQEALQLARLTLFDLDVWVIGHALNARKRVLGSMWRNSQMAALLSLSVEALKNSLKESISKSVEAELLASELEAAKDSKQQQGKAASKKKKKKGGAKPHDKSHMQKLIAVADESGDEDEAAARAADEIDAQQAEEDGAAEQQQAGDEGQADAWGPATPIVDMSKLGFSAHSDDYEEEQQQWKPASKADSSSRDSRNRAGSSSQAVSESALAGKPGREAAGRGPPARPAPGAAGQRTAGLGTQQQQQQQDPDEPVFAGPPVCSICGTIGHRQPECRIPFCEDCRKYGHAQGHCRDACRCCGRMHPVNPGSRYACTQYECHNCSLWGHEKRQCPHIRCSNCGRLGHIVRDCPACRQCRSLGHSAKDCPGYCSNCRTTGHDTASCPGTVCRACKQPGHTTGSPECPKSSKAAAAQPPLSLPAAAGDSRGSSSSRPGRCQSGAAAVVSKEPPGSKQLLPGNIKLLSAGQSRDMDELVNQVFAVAQDYATCLVGQDEKLKVLCRVSAADMQHILQQPDPGAFLEQVYTCFKASSTGSKLGSSPHQLTAAGCEAFVQALPPMLRSCLPDAWHKCKAWQVLEGFIANKCKEGWGARERAHFEEARKRATTVEASTAAAGASAGQQQGQQQQHRSGSREQLSSSGSTEQPSSSSGGGGGGGDAVQQQLPPPPPSVAAAGPARVSFKQAAEMQEQHPPLEQVHTERSAAASIPPGAMSQNPGYQQQQQQRQEFVQPLMPPSASYTIPPQPAPGHGYPAPEQQQQQLGGPPQVLHAPRMLPVDAFSGPLADWMLWHRPGADRAVVELVENAAVRRDLLKIIHEAEDHQVAQKLVEGIRVIMKCLVDQGADAEATKLVELAQMALNATKVGGVTPPPEPSPMPQPAAAMPGLLPHLQQQRGGSSHGAGATVLPPHLQQPHPQQRQHLPMWQAPPAVQQQQLAAAAAVDNGEDDSDDDALLGLLTNSSSGTTQQQPPKAGWNVQSAAAQQQGSVSFNPDFPMLGDEDGMQQAVAASLQSTSGSGVSRRLAVSAAGLANETGEYNCFLNVVVQCLWSCRDFRTQVWELPSATVAENAVVLALKRLFVQMQQAESGWQPGEDRAVVNPTELREALDTATHFRRQEMNDANELLDTLYECFKTAQPPSEHSHRGSRGVLVDSVFGLLVNEQVRCRQPYCGKATHKVASHWEHMLVVNTMGLQFAAMMVDGGATDMSQLLRTLFDQEQKMCDKDEGGCGTPYAPERGCEQAPKVLTLQLVWDQTVTGHDIAEALQYVQETVDINRLYAAGCMATETTYKLSSAVAYYGQHYMAFVFNPKLEAWLLFDDASISQVGDWQSVIKKCVSGKIQPSVLFYQTVDIASVAIPVQPTVMHMHHVPPPAAAPAMPPHMQPAPAAAGSGGYGALPPHFQPGGLHGAMGGPPPPQPMPVAAAAAGVPPVGWANRGPPQHMQPPPQQQHPASAAGAVRSEPGTRAGPPPNAYAGSWHTPQPAQGHDPWGAQPGVAAPQTAAPAAGPGTAAAPPPAAQQPAGRPPGPAWGGAGMASSRIAGQALAQAIGPAAAPGRGRGVTGPRTASAPASAGG